MTPFISRSGGRFIHWGISLCSWEIVALSLLPPLITLVASLIAFTPRRNLFTSKASASMK
ncbi:hypothetical protein Goklo_005345 [Gossypium klotzschianum]|uniref:Uncharacterized protein n=1 Tax=Gossypium klotzschianum TaxID=34286 RepID=A0A7J8VRR4_9ROSI|nr:hypothetical protein [Gossypium klotzschianum]